MPSSLYTLLLPTSSADFGAPLVLPAKTPEEERFCALDCTAWLGLAGTTIARVAWTHDPTLLVGNTSHDGRVILFADAGGVDGTTPRIGLALMLANGSREDVTIEQPIVAQAPAVPGSAVLVDGHALTVDYRPVELAELGPLPGGPADTDRVLLTRAGVDGAPNIAGTVAFERLGGGGSAFTSYMPAAAAIGGHRTLMVDPLGVVHAEPGAAGFTFTGLSLQAAEEGTEVKVCTSGAVTEPSWSWTPGAALFVGPGGALTAIPPNTGVLQQVAVATSATAIIVQPFPAITLL